MDHKRGKALIFVGPSGSGKTTIVKHLLAHNPTIRFSISACTRPKRPQEVHGRDYYFLSKQDFQDKITQGAFVEWHEVYKEQYYGTLKVELDRIWSVDKVAIFDIDVIGGLKLKKHLKERALAVYVSTPKLAVLEERLMLRGTESEESIALRMAAAQKEVTLAPQFDHVLANEDLEHSLEWAQKLLEEFLEA